MLVSKKETSMSNMFNMAAGYDPLAKYALTVLVSEGLDYQAIPRFRDAYFVPAGLRGNERDRVAILTRTGGNNRPDYASENEYLRSIPGFVSDEDDGFDSTFAHFFYELSDGDKSAMVADLIVQAREQGWDFRAPMERFHAAVERMKTEAVE